MKVFLIIFGAGMLFVVPFVLMLLLAMGDDDNSFYWMIASLAWYVACLAAACTVEYNIV